MMLLLKTFHKILLLLEAYSPKITNSEFHEITVSTFKMLKD